VAQRFGIVEATGRGQRTVLLTEIASGDISGGFGQLCMSTVLCSLAPKREHENLRVSLTRAISAEWRERNCRIGGTFPPKYHPRI